MTPSGWTNTTLDALAVPNGLQTGPFGSQLRAAQYATEGVPVVMPKDIAAGRVSSTSIARVPTGVAEDLARHRVMPGDLVFGRRGDIGRCALIRAEAGWLCGTGCLRARLDPTLAVPEFVLHLISSTAATQWLIANAVGQTMLNLNTDILGRLPLTLPPLAEQKKIAAILSSADEAIEATKTVISQLHVVKQSLMASLIKFGPRDRPGSWSTIPLLEAGHWLSGGTPSKQDAALWAGPIPWVSPKDMKRARLLDAEDHVAEAALGNGTQLAPAGSLLMVVRGMILAHSFPVALAAAPLAFNQDVKALVPTSTFEPEFLLYWFQASRDDVLRLVDVANHGTKRLPSERLFGLRVPRPPREEQARVCAIIRSVDTRVEAETRALAARTETKNALLAVLLGGELRLATTTAAA
jgi:type I restriction enzyme, S subunit